MNRKESACVVSAVERVVLHGYVYPAVEREDSLAGRPRRYWLELGEALRFIGLAAASGVVGELTVTAAKAIIRRARGSRRTASVEVRGVTEADGEIVILPPPHVNRRLRLTEDDVELFIKAIERAVRRGKLSISPRARKKLGRARALARHAESEAKRRHRGRRRHNTRVR